MIDADTLQLHAEELGSKIERALLDGPLSGLKDPDGLDKLERETDRLGRCALLMVGADAAATEGIRADIITATTEILSLSPQASEHGLVGLRGAISRAVVAGLQVAIDTMHAAIFAG